VHAPHERLLVAPDGTRLVVRTWNANGGGTPLVLCDGLGCDGYIWRYVVERFAPERPIFHMQYRGHGRSDVPADLETLRVPVLIDDLALALDETGVRGGVWLGHSMGVQVALEGFRRVPDRVQGLALLCGSYERPIDTWHHAFFAGEDPPLGNRIMRKVFSGLTRTVIDKWSTIEPFWKALVSSEFAFRTTVNGELTPHLIVEDDFRPYMAHLANMDMRVFARLARDLSEHSAADVLPTVDVPTLVVGGGRDRFAPLWISEEMHRRIPHSTLLRLVQGSHAAPIEEPRLLERALVRLLDAIDLHVGRDAG
jgi:pimeloyl-ACP methyl ester carboxylesterase